MNINNLKKEAFNLLLTNIYLQGLEDGKVYPEEGYGHLDWFYDTWSYAIRISGCTMEEEIQSLIRFLKNWRVVDCIETKKSGKVISKSNEDSIWKEK